MVGGGAEFRLNSDQTMTSVIEKSVCKRSLIPLWRRISVIFRNPEFRHRVFKNPPFVPPVSMMNPFLGSQICAFFFRSVYSIYSTNQMSINSYIRVLKTRSCDVFRYKPTIFRGGSICLALFVTERDIECNTGRYSSFA